MTTPWVRECSRTAVKRQLTIFYAVAATTLLLLAAGAFLASRHVAQNLALNDAMRTTDRLGKVVFAPLLGPGLTGDAHKLGDLRAAVQERLKDGFITEVIVWDVDGTVVFADNPTVEGTRLNPPDEVVAAITRGEMSTEFAAEPEVPASVAPGPDGLVEVYVPMRLLPGRTLALEVYYNFERVDNTATTLLWIILPVVILPLLIQQLIQIPIAASLARRVRRQEFDRSRMLEQALAMSEIERVRIAADLHDGPIQDLAGVGYALGAVTPSLPDQHQPLAESVGRTLHHAIDSLRRMMVDIYPPDLTTADLTQVITGLAAPLRENGVHVEVAYSRLPQLNTQTVTALYRTARETLLNVANHAHATHVHISLEEVPHDVLVTAHGQVRRLTRPEGNRTAVRLLITDNGVGLSDKSLDRRADGHLGIRLLQDRAHSMGGALTIHSPPTGGTTVTAVLPT